MRPLQALKSGYPLGEDRTILCPLGTIAVAAGAIKAVQHRDELGRVPKRLGGLLGSLELNVEPARQLAIEDAAASVVAAEIQRKHGARRGAFGRPAQGRGLVSRWNDEPGRTQAEVLAIFDSAIAGQRARIRSSS